MPAMPFNRRLMLGLVVATAAGAGTAFSQQQRSDPAVLQRILVAEDLRGTGRDRIAPLLAGAADDDSLIRRVSVRGLGRLQRPALLPRLASALADPAPAVRAEAANAIAQSVRHLRRILPGDSARRMAAAAERALLDAIARERNPATRDAIAEAIGRLPFADSSAARAAERVMREHAAAVDGGARPGVGALRGFHALALAWRQTGRLAAETVSLLRATAGTAADAESRRLAVLTLGITSALDTATTLAASRDADEQVRRLALAGVAGLALQSRSAVLSRALRDSSAIVRVGAVVATHVSGTAAECGPLLGAVRDTHPYVALMAIDSMGAPCPSDSARAALVRVLEAPRTGLAQHAWQAPAHALVTLARIDAAAVAPFIARMTQSARWQERMYAARAAAVVNDTTALVHFARDVDDNVREAGVAGLSRIAKHGADSVYITALGAHGNQAVLAAATALGGSTDPAAVPALFGALRRLTARRSENARDPRLMILRRIGELGGARDTAELAGYVADFDTTVARTSAALLSKWTGRRVAPRAVPFAVEPVALAETFLRGDTRLRVTMARASGGESFVVRLFGGEAPATVARVTRLARTHYYDGVVLHRVEPNFVVQGGGPGASEYIGYPRFMRDELGTRTHARGMLGISSRGRDTGDAQWFLNLADNPLLDHEYTVFGEVESGRDVAERILEGDAIARVEVLPASR